IALLRVARGPRGPAGPPEHCPAAVLTLRNRSLETAVLYGVILDLHGETLVRRIEARAFGHRPALERAVELEPEVVVEMARRVLLHHEGAASRPAPASPAPAPPGGLRRGFEVALATGFAQSHTLIFPRAATACPSEPRDRIRG